MGLPAPDGALRVAGMTSPLSDIQAEELGRLLSRPVSGQHPWPFGLRVSAGFGRDAIEPRRVTLTVVEVSADAAFENGRWRHPVRFMRCRPDLSTADLLTLASEDSAALPAGVGITADQAASIIGCSRNHIYRLARQGHVRRVRPAGRWAGFDLDGTEAYALAQVTRKSFAGHPYWVSTPEAASILGVSHERVRQLAASERIPALRHDGVWVFRRAQLEVVANARDTRTFNGEWWSGTR